MQLGGRAEFLYPFIWSRVISRCIRQRNSITFCADLGKSMMETLAMIRQVFGEESMSHTLLFEWYCQTHRDKKKTRLEKRKVMSMVIIFFDIKGIVHKEFVLTS
jgi:hypothetical protein